MKFKNLFVLTASAAVLLHAETNPSLAGWPFSRKPATASCNAPACTPACAAPSTAPAPETAPAPPQTAPAQPQAAPALFAAPPHSGEITGESYSVGLRLPAITVPEMRLGLPTIHMPSIVRTRRGPEMYVDGGRAPLATGAPAYYGHLANVGPAAVAPQNAPVTAPAPPATAPAPAPAASNCVQTTSIAAPGLYDAQAAAAQEELQETRRMLDVYRREFENLKRTVEASGIKAADTSDELVPPPPAPVPRQTSLKLRNAHQRKVEAAGFFEEEAEPEEITQPAPKASAPVKRSGRSMPADQPTAANVGYSYQVEEDPSATGMGIWKGNGKREGTSSGKRSPR